MADPVWRRFGCILLLLLLLFAFFRIPLAPTSGEEPVVPPGIDEPGTELPPPIAPQPSPQVSPYQLVVPPAVGGALPPVAPVPPPQRAPSGPLPKVSVVVAWYPNIHPTWVYPGNFPCSGVRCQLHYDPAPQLYGLSPANKKWLKTANLYVVYINHMLGDDFYDVYKNPYNLTLMIVNNENLHGREYGLSNMKHWWISRFAKDPFLWERFNIVMSLEHQSTIPWFYFTQILSIPEVDPWMRANPPLRYDDKYRGSLALLIASHPGHTYNRFRYLYNISEHMTVDYFSGKRKIAEFFAHRKGAPNIKQRPRPDCPQSTWYHPTTTLCLIRPYFFNLALENSLARDYVTEKIYDPMLAGTVPVYYGAPNIENYLPPRAAILVTDFPSIAALVHYLKCVAGRRELYEYYRAWRTRTSPYWQKMLSMPHPLCVACQLVARNDPILQNVSHRIPRPLPLQPENVGNQRPFEQCLLPGTSLPDRYATAAPVAGP
eukprot:TRINITY_DN29390_c0_g1_i1.p1 TRINITY_DN29390_c0_g1~~TRINITY_DN29390_c0_g1_i1.p1  ORF type:complete len:496 (-),score=78.83 TRINITY_DN29390_c0_g1_i1:59-1522(-)